MALLLSATALLIYQLRSYQKTWIDDLDTQARIIASRAALRLTFDDPKVVSENLALLAAAPPDHRGAGVPRRRRLFRELRASRASGVAVPPHAQIDAVVIDNDRLELFQPIRENGERVGTVYLRSHFDILGRLVDYLMILAAVMVPSLLVAALVSRRLQTTLTAPILGVAQVARNVLTRRDFSLRAAKTSDDEVGRWSTRSTTCSKRSASAPRRSSSRTTICRSRWPSGAVPRRRCGRRAHQGPVPRDARTRAAQSARAHHQRGRDPAPRRRQQPGQQRALEIMRARCSRWCASSTTCWTSRASPPARCCST
jgi:hypothetical protein